MLSGEVVLLDALVGNALSGQRLLLPPIVTTWEPARTSLQLLQSRSGAATQARTLIVCEALTFECIWSIDSSHG